MPLPQEKIYTIQDIYALPDGERAELIDGKIYYMAPPSRKHQKLSMELSYFIQDFIKKHHGSCEVYTAPFAVFLSKDDKTYVEPDISVICDSDKLTDRGCVGAPDWIIEIVSPSSKAMDYYTKLIKYRDAGVKDYWIVDPMKERIMVYYLKESEPPMIYHFTDKVKANIYANLEIDFAQL